MGELRSFSRRRRRVISIRIIITFAAVALVSASVIGVGWVAERNTRRVLTAEIENRLLAEARNLALLSSEALLTEFPELTLYPVVSEMLTERSELAFAVVLDHQGRIQGHVDARKLGTEFSLLNEFSSMTTDQGLHEGEDILGDEDLLLASVPVRRGEDQMLGKAIVGLRREHLDGLLAQSRQELLFVATVLLGGGILSALLLMSLLLRPVGALRRGLERIGLGDLDTPMHLRDRTEFGLLADTVDEMAVQLKASRREAATKEREIIDTQKEVIHTLGSIVESRSRETANHIVRVGKCSRALALLAGLSEDEADLVLLASPMHDVGKVGIPDHILNKPGRLTPREHEIIKTHTTTGYNLLKNSEREIMKAAAVIAHEHHERWDGTGYPRGLAGEDIHIYGRIVALADVFDALSSERVYKRAIGLEEVRATLEEERGRHFDPHLLDLFLDHFDEFVAVQKAHSPEAAPRGAMIELDAPKLTVRDLSALETVSVFLDGNSIGGETTVIALGVTLSGEKSILGFVQAAVDDEAVIAEFLAGLRNRGLDVSQGVLVVTGDNKGLCEAVRSSLGPTAVIQRCLRSRQETILAHLPGEVQPSWQRRLQKAYERPTYEEASRALRELRRDLEATSRSALAFLDTDLEETLALHRLGLFLKLGRTFKNTSVLETVTAAVEKLAATSDAARDPSRKHRWLAGALLDIEPTLRKAMGYRHMPLLREALAHEIDTQAREESREAA